MKVIQKTLASFLLLSIGITTAFTVPRTKSTSNTVRFTPTPLYKNGIIPSSTSTTTLFGEKGTIQILMSDTGGGHRASANALRDAFDELYPGQIEVDIVDIFTDYGPFFPFDQFVPIYKILAEYPFLWEWTFYSGATPFGLWLNELVLELCCFEPFKECMTRPSGSSGKRADMVVSVHPLTQDIPLKILNYVDSSGKSRSSGRTTPFATVVTDLGGAHPTWFNPGVDKCFVPSDALYKCARDRNVKPEQIVQLGLPIRKGFWASKGSKEPNKNIFDGLLDNLTGSSGKSKQDSGSSIMRSKDATKSKYREQLGLMDDIPTVLIVGGGDGMGGIIQQAKALGEKLNEKADSKENPEYQMVVVCGKNQNAQDTLSSNDWGKGVNVVVNGFVNNMDEWMRASDVIVTKAGPGTIAEASICGLPCMLSSYLPGQEAGNVPYVEDSGFGTYSGEPKTIADTVSTWLSSPEKLQSMKEAALEASRPTATIDIAKDLAKMLFEEKAKQAKKAKVAKPVLVSN